LEELPLLIGKLLLFAPPWLTAILLTFVLPSLNVTKLVGLLLLVPQLVVYCLDQVMK
jgi:hypothetical protein